MTHTPRLVITSLLGVNLTIGILALIASPITWTPIFALCILGSILIWTGTRHDDRRTIHMAIVAIALVGIGLILITPNASAEVVFTVDAGASESATDVWAPDTSTYYVCYGGSQPQELKVAATTNGGVSWSNATVAPSGEYLDTAGENVQDCSLSGANNTVIVGWKNRTTDDPMVSYSTDGGATWTDTIVDDAISITGEGVRVHAVNETRWYVTGVWSDGADFTSDHIFCSTTNSGTLWSCDEIAETNSVGVDMEVLSAQDILVAGSSGSTDVFVSTNGGSSWTAVDTGKPAGAMRALGAVDLDTWIFAREDSAASPDRLITYCTEDQGATAIPVCGLWDIDSGGDSTLDRWGSSEIEATPSGLPYYFAWKDPVNGKIKVTTKTNSGGGGDRSWSGNNTICVNQCDGIGLHVFGTDSWLVSFSRTGGDEGVFLAVEGGDAETLTCSGCTDVRTSYDNTPNVYIRDETANQLFRTDQDLVAQQTVALCSGTRQVITTLGSSRGDIGVTVDGKVIATCAGTQSNQVIVTTPTFQDPRTTPVEVLPVGVESFTANVITVWDPGDTSQNVVSVDGFNLNQDATLTLTGVEDFDVEKFGSNRSAFTGSFGTEIRLRSSLQLSLRNTAIQGLCVAIHNNTVWVGDLTSITRYDISGGEFVENVTTTNAVCSTGATGGMRVSKDGAYLWTWDGQDLYYMDSVNLTVLQTETLSQGIHAIDSDFLNNYLYVATEGFVTRFDIFDLTSSVAGDGTPGQPNPAPTNNPFNNFESVADDPGIIDDGSGTVGGGALDQPAGTVELFNIPALEDRFGLTGASAFIAMLIIIAIAGGVWMFTENTMISGGAGALAFVFTFQIGLIPQWVVFLLGIIVIGGVVMLMSGRR